MAGKSTYKAVDKEELFAAHYIANGMNGTKAAQAAGFSPSNDKAAAVKSSNLLKKANVKRIIEKAKEHELLKLQITSDRVYAALGEMAFDGDYVKEQDRIKALALLAKIMGIDRPEGGSDQLPTPPVIIDLSGDGQSANKLKARIGILVDVEDDEGEEE